MEDINSFDDKYKLVENNENEQDQSAFNYGNEIPAIIKFYIEENLDKDFVKSDIFKKFWATFNKNLKFAFITSVDMVDIEADFMQCYLTFLMSVPSYDYTITMQSDLENIRLHWRAIITRARGTNMGVVNERTMQATTISQMFRSSQQDDQNNNFKPTKNNFFKKLGNLF